MTNKFIITGHPRSRSAWFAAYLTCGDTFCTHEGLLRDYWPEGYKNSGTADSSFSLVQRLVNEDFADSTLVMIDRDIEEVRSSIKALNIPVVEGSLEFAQGMMLMMPAGLRVKFTEINVSLPQIHDYLEIPFEQKRAALFCQLNIQSRHYMGWDADVDLIEWEKRYMQQSVA